MTALVKMELPEATEFDVYLDVDGVADDIPYIASDGQSESVCVLDGRAGTIGASWHRSEAQPRTGPNVVGSSPALQLGVQQPVVPSIHAVHDDDDTEVEIDIDTPFDERLRGQTQPRVEPYHSSLVSRLMNYASVTGPVSNVARKSTTMGKSKKPAAPSVARKSTTIQKKVKKNIATKSTTPRQTSKQSVSNFARKSTAKKQLQHVLPVSTKQKTFNTTDKTFPFRFSQGKSTSPKMSSVGKTVKTASLPSTSKDKVQEILANYASRVASSNSSKPFTARKTFTFTDKSEDLMGCPECGLRVQQRSLRNHLRNMHNLFMRTCKKCRLSFTDLDMFSEHYALHLQHEEDYNSGIPSQPFQLKGGETPVQPTGPQKMYVASRKMSAKRPSPEEFHGDFDPESTELRFPVRPKLPPKPRKPSPSKKRLVSPSEASESSFTRYLNEHSLLPEKKCFSLDSESSPYAQGPSTSRKRYASQSPPRKLSSSPCSLSRDSLRERSPSPSIHSEASFSSDFSDTRRSTSHYRENKKALYRKKTVSTTYIATPEKNRLCEVITVTVSRRYCEEAKVSLVSLENASQPFDCKTCMAAFNTALTCPRSFRRYFQMASNNCSAASSESNELRADEEITPTPLEHYKASDITISSLDTKHKTPLKGRSGLYECEVCRKRFQYRSLLLRHVAYHSYRYSCGICKKAFQEKIHLLDHFQIAHAGRSRMLCRYCGKEFENFSELDRHILTHKGGTEVACTVCNQKFSDSTLMQMHLKFTHGGSESSDKQAVERVGNSKPTGKHACKVCGKKFHLTHKLSLHMKIAHHRPGHKTVTKFLSCRICNRVFNMRKGLSSHYRHCHGMSLLDAMSSEEADTVPHSHFQSKTSAFFKSKSASVNDARGRVPCLVCESNFSTRKIMMQHYRRIHKKTSIAEMSKDDSSPLECRVCGKIVNTTQGLKTHYKIRHKRAMPPSKVVKKKVTAHNFFTKVAQKTADSHKCLKCDKTFSQATNLSRHMRITHSKAVNMTGKGQPGTWVCQICGVPFSKRKAMRFHIKLYHPESYRDERLGSRKCSRCGKPFGNRSRLLAHMQLCQSGQTLRKSLNEHTGRLFPCLLCEKKFIWKNSAFRHMVINHKLSKKDIVYNLSDDVDNVSLEVPKTSLGKKSQPAETNEKFLCKMCKDCFIDKGVLKRHQLARHGGDRSGFFQCRVQSCQKTFTRNENLLKHIKGAHPGMQQFRCWECKAGFDNKEEVFEHSCFPVGVEKWETSDSHRSEFEFGQSTSQSHEHGPSTSHIEEQESRYRCTACGLGFHIAREWTKHMQEHAKEAGAGMADYEKVMDTTEDVRLNVFDVMSAGDICACQLCGKIYTDEEALAQHTCVGVQSSIKKLSSASPKGSFFGKKNSNYQPVKCTVCLKFFSPLSIKRHMMNLHSLPMKMCRHCNIVFTDLGCFERHCEMHKQQETTDLEDVANSRDVENATSFDDSTEESLTFFVCPDCGGLFNDVNSLKLHECTGEDNYSEHSDLHEDTLSVMSAAVPGATTDVSDISKVHDSQTTDQTFYSGVFNNTTGEITREQQATNDHLATISNAELSQAPQDLEVLSSKQDGADGEFQNNEENLPDLMPMGGNGVAVRQSSDHLENSPRPNFESYKENDVSGDKSQPVTLQEAQELEEAGEPEMTADKEIEDKTGNQANYSISEESEETDKNNVKTITGKKQVEFECGADTGSENQQGDGNSSTVVKEAGSGKNIVEDANNQYGAKGRVARDAKGSISSEVFQPVVTHANDALGQHGSTSATDHVAVADDSTGAVGDADNSFSSEVVEPEATYSDDAAGQHGNTTVHVAVADDSTGGVGDANNSISNEAVEPQVTHADDAVGQHGNDTSANVVVADDSNEVQSHATDETEQKPK